MQVHLTQRLFQANSLPFLFREFHLLPCRGDEYDDAALEEYLNKAPQRLQFWASAKIAPLVQYCSARIWSGSSTTHNSSITNVLAEFFDFVQHFTNLRRLDLSRVEYTPIFLRNVRLLPNLTRLEVSLCSMPQGEKAQVDLTALSPLEISEFIYRRSTSPSNPELWFPFLRRTKLRNFYMSYDEWMFTQVLSGDTFPFVTRLTFSFADTSLALAKFIAKFPATEILALHCPPMEMDEASDERTALSGVLTSLKTYEGPEDLLDIFLPIHTLYRVTLPYARRPEDYLAKLRKIQAPNHISSLRIEFSDFSHGALRDLCGFFPHLADLRIEVVIEEDDFVASWDVYNFFEHLAQELPFPAKIEKFAIRWEYEDDNPHIENGPPDLPSLKDALVSKYPSIKAIWVDGSPGLLYRWRLGEVGVQYCGNNEDDAYWGAGIPRFQYASAGKSTYWNIQSGFPSARARANAPQHSNHEIEARSSELFLLPHAGRPRIDQTARAAVSDFFFLEAGGDESHVVPGNENEY
ncbi:hypothetical protein K438DRAFT_1933593 [Mycena galopus ATCC 62051]|nr:hypothetical protein K438DRAFT_1933593 [Mycena galopus ATCC 62051]